LLPSSPTSLYQFNDLTPKFYSETNSVSDTIISTRAANSTDTGNGFSSLASLLVACLTSAFSISSGARAEGCTATEDGHGDAWSDANADANSPSGDSTDDDHDIPE
jgi:hypothetical protein